jgi:XapX domain-containing protein
MDSQKAHHSGYDEHSVDVDDHGTGRRFKFGGGDNPRWQPCVAAIPAMIFGAFAGARMLAYSISLALAVVFWHSRDVRSGPQALAFRRERIVKIAIGFVLSFIIGAGCRYFDIPAASPPVIPGALIVLAMTLGYSSMDRLLIRRDRPATTKRLCGGPTGVSESIASSMQQSRPETRGRS